MRRADLRDHLVSAASARDRVLGRVDRDSPGDIHGRHVSRQPAAPALHPDITAPAPSLCRAGVGDRDERHLGRVGHAVRGECSDRGPRIRLDSTTCGRVLLVSACSFRRCSWERPFRSSRDGSRKQEATPENVVESGFLYGGNTAGAVFGCLLAGFYLLRVDDMLTATFVAAALNLLVGVIAWTIAARSPHEPCSIVAEAFPRAVVVASGAWPVYVTIALSGLCALGAEVVWTRLLSLMLGASVYTFSIILAVFLLGLGIGSTIGSYLGRGQLRPWVALAWCQLAQAAGIAWTAYMIARALPYWPINPSLAPSAWFNFQLDVERGACARCSLPRCSARARAFHWRCPLAASRGGDPGRLVGGIYAANTVGAIGYACTGSLGFSLAVAIPAHRHTGRSACAHCAFRDLRLGGARSTARPQAGGGCCRGLAPAADARPGADLRRRGHGVPGVPAGFERVRRSGRRRWLRTILHGPGPAGNTCSCSWRRDQFVRCGLAVPQRHQELPRRG